MSLADRIHLESGDLTEKAVDAIVNAANNDLKLGGGLAGVVRRKGGDEIQRECDAIGSVPVGGAAITSGGRLKARHIIHAASMQLGGATDARALRSSTAHALRIADEHKLRTVAFPAVGTGIGGFPIDECAAIMLHEAAEHLKGPTAVEQIHFVLFDEATLAAFSKRLEEMKISGEFGEGANTASTS